ncbi:MAG: vitamin K epoxide reductase, partial [Acidimicrobiia bacterium]|nr:vitamin K epoxide reductase [Acidimicrobiia bacterium]
RVADRAAVLVAATALGGTLFSIYLTFLEPFVIGATCLWCLTSALCIVGLLWLTAGPGWAAFQRLRGSRSTST